MEYSEVGYISFREQGSLMNRVIEWDQKLKRGKGWDEFMDKVDEILAYGGGRP